MGQVVTGIRMGEMKEVKAVTTATMRGSSSLLHFYLLVSLFCHVPPNEKPAGSDATLKNAEMCVSKMRSAGYGGPADCLTPLEYCSYVFESHWRQTCLSSSVCVVPPCECIGLSEAPIHYPKENYEMSESFIDTKLSSVFEQAGGSESQRIKNSTDMSSVNNKMEKFLC